MSASKESLKLILAGNTRVPAMINAIIRATIKARENTSDENLCFKQVYIFHTQQSLEALVKSEEKWKEALGYYRIPTNSLVYYVAEIEDSNVDRFKDLIEQLRTIVNPLDNVIHYIDLTGGISSLKTILAVFAYVLDIDQVYSLEIQFSDDFETRREQTGLFYHELESRGVKSQYRKFPPICEFDTFGRLNYTEILRHRQIIDELIQTLTHVLPSSFDVEHLRASMLSGTNSRLMGEVTGELYNYRHSLFSFSAGVEEIANIILNIIIKADIEKKPLGIKLEQIRDHFSSNAKYFINEKILNHLTKLITEVRNDNVHPNIGSCRSREMFAIQTQLSSQLSLSFLQFAVKTLTAFCDQDGKLLEVQVIDPPKMIPQTIFYFGFDGDATGDYLEVAFVKSDQSESEVIKRSQSIFNAIKLMRKLICKNTQDNTSVLFAEGDNILFKAQYLPLLLRKLQETYKEKTGLCSSIGYGRTLRESTIALRLAKGKDGDSIVGISLKGKKGDN